jgi:hypothetical protein
MLKREQKNNKRETHGTRKFARGEFAAGYERDAFEK